jgi:hypothetical protein
VSCLLPRQREGLSFIWVMALIWGQRPLQYIYYACSLAVGKQRNDDLEKVLHRIWILKSRGRKHSLRSAAFRRTFGLEYVMVVLVCLFRQEPPRAPNLTFLFVLGLLLLPVVFCRSLTISFERRDTIIEKRCLESLHMEDPLHKMCTTLMMIFVTPT